MTNLGQRRNQWISKPWILAIVFVLAGCAVTTSWAQRSNSEHDPFGGDSADESPLEDFAPFDDPNKDPFGESTNNDPFDEKENKDPFGQSNQDSMDAADDDPFAQQQQPSQQPRHDERDPFANHNGGRAQQTSGRGTAGVPPQTRAQIKKRLARNIAFEFYDTPLEEVIEFFQQESDVEIEFDIRALDDYGLDSSLPITAELKSVTFGEALRFILAPHDLEIVIRDGYVLITSDEGAQEFANTKVYPVRKLLKEDQPIESMNALIETLTSCVAQDTWSENGGNGTIEDYQGTLVIHQSDEAHDKIEALLHSIGTAINNAGGPTLPISKRPNGPTGGFGQR